MSTDGYYFLEDNSKKLSSFFLVYKTFFVFGLTSDKDCNKLIWKVFKRNYSNESN